MSVLHPEHAPQLVPSLLHAWMPVVPASQEHSREVSGVQVIEPQPMQAPHAVPVMSQDCVPLPASPGQGQVCVALGEHA